MDNMLKDSDLRDYELYLESLKPTDEELDFWLQDMYKKQKAYDRKQNSEFLNK